MNSHALNVIEFPRTLALIAERATSPLGGERVRELRPVTDRAAIAGGATQIGAVMGKVLPQFKGRADGGTINAIAREELSKQG